MWTSETKQETVKVSRKFCDDCGKEIPRGLQCGVAKCEICKADLCDACVAYEESTPGDYREVYCKSCAEIGKPYLERIAEMRAECWRLREEWEARGKLARQVRAGNTTREGMVFMIEHWEMLEEGFDRYPDLMPPGWVDAEKYAGAWSKHIITGMPLVDGVIDAAEAEESERIYGPDQFRRALHDPLPMLVEINCLAGELLKLIESSEPPSVEISLTEKDNWIGAVFPSFSGSTGREMLTKRWYTSTNLPVLLERMYIGTSITLDQAKRDKLEARWTHG